MLHCFFHLVIAPKTNFPKQEIPVFLGWNFKSLDVNLPYHLEFHALIQFKKAILLFFLKCMKYWKFYHWFTEIKLYNLCINFIIYYHQSFLYVFPNVYKLLRINNYEKTITYDWMVVSLLDNLSQYSHGCKQTQVEIYIVHTLNTQWKI